MKSFTSLLVVLIVIFAATVADAQKRKTRPLNKSTSAATPRTREIGSTAVVIDESLSVLRDKPSLFAEPVQRMRRGRKVVIQNIAEADGVRFYKVAAPPANFGWVQADAVFGAFRPADEERLARFVKAADGFDQIEIANEFFDLYPRSQFRPALLLLYGDLLEEVAAKLTKDSGSRISRREMAASGAPPYSYYLNFVSLDRYRKLGILFLFNAANRSFHYDGASWNEIVKKYPSAPEAVEAQKRLDTLKVKMAAVPQAK